MELSVQLAIIMVGRQAINACIEICVPLLRKWYNLVFLRTSRQSPDTCWPQWANDFYLISFDSYSLFYEYLEMSE